MDTHIQAGELHTFRDIEEQGSKGQGREMERKKDRVWPSAEG